MGFIPKELSPAEIRSLYRRFLMSGFSKEQASNLVASIVGLEPQSKGWTIKEIIYLLFISKLDLKG